MSDNDITTGKVERGIGPYWLPDGTKLWKVRYSIGRGPNRKQRTRGGFATKTEADNWRAENIVQRRSGTYVDNDKGNVTIADFAVKWFANAQLGVGVRRALRPKTVAWYETLLRRHVYPHIGDVRWNELSTAVVEDWLATLATKPAKTESGRLSGNTIAKAYRLLHEIADAAVRLGHLNASPCKVRGAGSEEKPDTTRYEDVVDPDVVRALADRMRDHKPEKHPKTGKGMRPRKHASYRSLVLLTGFCGLRWGEAVALSRRDVDWNAGENGAVRVRRQVEEISGHLRIVDYTKTSAGHRTVALPEEVATALLEHLNTLPDDQNTLLWTGQTRGGERSLLRHGNFRRSVWKPACRAVGVDLRWHDLRHICGRLMALAGVPLPIIMKQMGHDSLEAATRYLTAVEATQHVASERMDAFLSTAPAATGTDNVMPLRRP